MGHSIFGNLATDVLQKEKTSGFGKRLTTALLLTQPDPIPTKPLKIAFQTARRVVLHHRMSVEGEVPRSHHQRTTSEERSSI